MLHDNMTAVLNRQAAAADNLRENVDGVGRSTDSLNMAEQFEQANTSLGAVVSLMAQLVNETEQNGSQLSTMNERLDNLNRQTQQSQNLWGGVGTAIKTALSFLSISKVKDFVNEVFELNNTQMTVEVQLATVLNNQGEGMDAFDQIRKKASEIQGKTMYGDEAMIAGAAELSTYISDPEAISSMMDTLSNYAAGMSGGGAVDTSAMTEYATQLGKALDGTYDGLKKKGFELSEEQQEIIENGTDMEKALVLDEVIGQSWENLAENMRQTPTGIITSIQNSIGDMGEVIGARLTPAFMELANAAYNFLQSGGVQQAINDIIGLLTWVFGILETGIGIVQTVIDNWSWIGPIVGTIAAAVIALNAATTVYNVTTGIATALKAAHQAATLLSTGSTLAEVAATKTATGAQIGFNTALLACPITWIIVAVIALIGLIYLIGSKLNETAGTATSVFGVFLGGLWTVGAFFKNIGLVIANFAIGCWDALEALGGNIYICFHNAITGVQSFWYGLLSTVLTVVEGICEALNKIPFIDFDYSGVSNAAADFANKSAELANSKLDYNDLGAAFDAGNSTFETFGDGWAEEAFSEGAAIGDGLYESIFGSDGGTEDDPYSYDYESMFGDSGDPTGTEDDPIHTEVDNDINIADEDLQLMRDVAEARYVQNFVTLTPTVQVSGNTINEKADIKSMVDEIEYRLTSEIAASAEGVYG